MAVPWVYLKGGKMLGDEGKQLPLLESNFYHASGIRLVDHDGGSDSERTLRLRLINGNSHGKSEIGKS